MQKTKIEYLTHTSNPIAMRCTPVSAGCQNCWHINMANRMSGMTHLPQDVRDAYSGKGRPVLLEHELDKIRRRKKPAIIGLQFMGDLFHENLDSDQHHAIFDMIYDCPQHIFMTLTKRPRRIHGSFPDNVWVGVSVEDQETANERIPQLSKIQCKHKWVSLEPLLGEVNCRTYEFTDEIDFITIGGETGRGARPADASWFKTVSDACKSAEAKYFFKQWGGPYNLPHFGNSDDVCSTEHLTRRELPDELAEIMAMYKDGD